MPSTTPVSAGIAFLAGFVSFVSPCVLPLVPAYLSLLTGESVESLREGRSSPRAIAHAVAFVAGFMFVFILLGWTANWFGATLRENSRVIAEIGGIVVIFFGLQMMGMIQPLPLLMRDTRVHVAQRRRTLWASLLVGIAFAAGWTPCIGPALAAILVLASQEHGNGGAGAFLLFCYSLGLALPFLIVAAAVDAILPVLARMRTAMRAIEFAAGAFLVLVGFVLANDAFLNIAGWFYSFVPQPKI